MLFFKSLNLLLTKVIEVLLYSITYLCFKNSNIFFKDLLKKYFSIRSGLNISLYQEAIYQDHQHYQYIFYQGHQQ